MIRKYYYIGGFAATNAINLKLSKCETLAQVEKVLDKWRKDWRATHRLSVGNKPFVTDPKGIDLTKLLNN